MVFYKNRSKYFSLSFSNAQKKWLSMYFGLVIQVNEELCLPQTRLRAGYNKCCDVAVKLKHARIERAKPGVLCLDLLFSALVAAPMKACLQI